MPEAYLDELQRGIPKTPLNILKYPSKKGLRISHPEERKRILHYLWSLRAYSLAFPDDMD